MSQNQLETLIEFVLDSEGGEAVFLISVSGWVCWAVKCSVCVRIRNWPRAGGCVSLRVELVEFATYQSLSVVSWGRSKTQTKSTALKFTKPCSSARLRRHHEGLCTITLDSRRTSWGWASTVADSRQRAAPSDLFRRLSLQVLLTPAEWMSKNPREAVVSHLQQLRATIFFY